VLESELQGALADVRLGNTFKSPDFGAIARYQRDQGDHIVQGGVRVNKTHCSSLAPVESWPFRIRGDTPLDTQSIIAELEAERDRLNSAIAALQGGQGKAGRTASGKTGGRRRKLSAAARRRIGLAMKKCWAERKKKAAA
jgi:hypothetical protein